MFKNNYIRLGLNINLLEIGNKFLKLYTYCDFLDIITEMHKVIAK